MNITVEKTGVMALSMAYQAKAHSIDLEVMAAMYGNSADDARSKLVDELKKFKKLNSEIDDFLTIESHSTSSLFRPLI